MDDILTPGEVARLFKVDRTTVTRWAEAGKLPSFLTPGGQRRFYRLELEPMLRSSSSRPRGGALVEATIPPHGEAGGGPPGQSASGPPGHVGAEPPGHSGHPPRGRSGVKGG